MIDGRIDSLTCAINNVADTEPAARDPMSGTVRMVVSFRGTQWNLEDVIRERRNEGESEGERRWWKE